MSRTPRTPTSRLVVVSALLLSLASLTGCSSGTGSFGPQPKVAPGPINVASAEGPMDTSGPRYAKDRGASHASAPVGRSSEATASRPRR